MSGIRARVKDGRLQVDEPTALPDGTVLELVVDDEGDDLSESERQALNAAIDQAWEDANAGRLNPAGDVIERLRLRSK